MTFDLGPSQGRRVNRRETETKEEEKIRGRTVSIRAASPQPFCPTTRRVEGALSRFARYARRNWATGAEGRPRRARRSSRTRQNESQEAVHEKLVRTSAPPPRLNSIYVPGFSRISPRLHVDYAPGSLSSVKPQGFPVSGHRESITAAITVAPVSVQPSHIRYHFLPTSFPEILSTVNQRPNL